jgi:hypothetical protein
LKELNEGAVLLPNQGIDRGASQRRSMTVLQLQEPG